MQNSSFFDSIKSQIPSIDSDLSSSSDNEEDISVYQRPSVFRFPEGIELDLNCMSLEEPDIEDLLKSVKQPFLYSSDGGLGDQNDDLRPAEHRDQLAQTMGPELEVPTINSTKPESTTSQYVDNSKPLGKDLVNECDSDKDADERGCTSDGFPQNKRSQRKSRGEVCRTHLTERKVMLNSQPLPILSLEPLENWDLDDILRSLKQPGHHNETVKQDKPVQPFIYTDYDSQRKHVNILEQLVAFCKKQERKEIESVAESEKVQSGSKNSRSTNGWTKTFNEQLLEKDHPPTVYIDLRYTEHETKPVATCNTCPSALRDERVGHTQAEALTRRGMLTGKSSLLQRIRESDGVRSERSDRTQTPGDPAEPQRETITGFRTDQTTGVRTDQTTGVRAHQTTGVRTDQTTGVRTDQTTGVRTHQTTGVRTHQTTGVRTHQTTGVRTDQTTGVRADQTTGVRAGQTTGVRTHQTTGVRADQTIGVRTDQTTGVRADQTTGVRADQITGVRTDQTTGVRTHQTTGVRTDQTTGVKTDQTTGVRADQTTGVRAHQTTGVRTDQTTGVRADQTTGVRADQTTGVRADQTTGVRTDQTTGVRADQTTGVRTDQTTGVRADQITGVRADQTTGVRADQTTGVRTDQTTGVRADQITGVRADQTTGVRADQTTGVKTDQTTGVRADQTTGVRADQTTGVRADQTTRVRADQPTGVRVDQTSWGTSLSDKRLVTTSSTTARETAAPVHEMLSSHKKAEGHIQEHKSGCGQEEEQRTRAHRQQDLSHLLTFTPQPSTNGKQGAAETTDVLYNTDGSNLPSLCTLPPDVSSRECLLLTVSLLSPGVVAQTSQGQKHTVASTSDTCHVYNSLVAWFMSLAEPNKGSGEDRNAAPFWVGGLQQFWRDDALVLYVCAVSHEDSQCLKPMRRDAEMGQSSFHGCVSRFLSNTHLRTVVSWLPQLNELLERQGCPTSISLCSSCLSCFISISPDKEAVERAFGMNPGFYWQTLVTQDQICQRAEVMTSQPSHTEVVFALAYRPLFLNPLATHHTLQLLLSSGLDVCGLRLAYPSHELLANTGVHVTGRGEYSQDAVLVLAIRGPYARSVWQDITGPSDPRLAQKTDPASINALHSSSRGPVLFHSLRLDSIGSSVWVGGRAPEEGVVVAEPVQGWTDTAGSGEPWSAAALCATTKADVFLLVSPVVAPCCYSHVLSACAKRGFQLLGLQRAHIPSERAPSLGLGPEQVSVFCGAPTMRLGGGGLEMPSQCLVLLLRRENVLRHSAALPAGVMTELAVKGLVGVLRTWLVGGAKPLPHLCFHTVPYMENHLTLLGGLMWTVPDYSRVVLANHSYPSCSDMEQMVVLTLTGSHIVDQGLSLLHKVLTGVVAVGQGTFELLALKWLPALSGQEAVELSPFEVGERGWRSSVTALASSPALVCVLRRPRALGTLRGLMPQDYPADPSVLMSSTPEVAFRQTCVFFSEAELVPDHGCRTLLKFLPSPSGGMCGFSSFYSYMTEGPLPLFTLALVRPGAWNRRLGRILRQTQRAGFTVAGMRILTLSRETAEALTHTPASQDSCGRDSELQHFTSGPALVLCLQRVNAIKRLLDLLGSDDPTRDGTEDQHLWRAGFGSDKLKTIYGSESYQQAVEHVKLLFSEGLCCTETAIMKYEQIPCLNSDPLCSLEREQSHTVAAFSKNNLSESLIKDLGQIGAGDSVRSALCQTTCLIVPSSLLQLSRATLHLDLLEQLLRTGCHLVAGRLCKPDKDQRKHISELLRPPGGGTGHEILAEVPCLILALQKDNIVTCFDSILESVCRDRPDFEKVRESLLYPRCENKALNLLCFLFDDLSPDSYHSIVPR
ncbi:dynein axonemal assembly factor 8 isoform X2 [Brachyhypopomus gauderio]|uniref:dynein axonemal assembly factor 8 isoform X2 n=1 Tax=Brachyhypopomus gauderio TaxID=698409 RepID=UPI0040437545